MDTLNDEEKHLINTLAFSNSGATILILSNKDVTFIISIISMFHNITQNDITSHIHVYDYPHIQYLQLIRTLFINPPMNMNTYVLKGEDMNIDMNVYDDGEFDVIFVLFESISTCFDVLSQLWVKLKSNGTLVMKGLLHSDTIKLTEFQNKFVSSIVVPMHIPVNIHLIQGTNDIIAIKKPCY